MEENKEECNKLCKQIRIKGIKDFLNKDNFFKTKIIISAVLSILLSIIFEYKFYLLYIGEGYDSKTRMMIICMAFFFVFLHGILKLDKMYEFIYKQRYKLAVAFMLFVMVLKLSGSSIVYFNEIVQTKADDNRYHPLLGYSRMIRTDEWASSTLYMLSQGVGQNQYEYFSDKLRGTTTDMFTLVNSPVKDILMLGKPFQIMFIILGNDYGLSFYWYIRLIVMLLGSFELCMIITNRKKLVSLCGMLMITFSAAVQWWYCMDTLLWGQVILVLLNKFMTTEKKYAKYLCAFGEIVAITSYIFILYPAWQVSFAYVFLALGIFIIIKNFKNGYKLNLHDNLVILGAATCVGALIARWLMLSGDTISAIMNTDYPGDRRELGGGALTLYSYVCNLFFAYKYCANPCEAAVMLSFYPIPIILSILYLIRNRKEKRHWIFLIPTIAVSLFLLAWCKLGFPEFLAKITAMSMTTTPRVVIPLGAIQIYMLIYLLSEVKENDKWIDKRISYILPILILPYIIYKSVYSFGVEGYMGKLKIAVSVIIFGIAIWGIFNINKERIKKYTILMLMFIALVTGIAVNPVIRTTDIIYTKPICKKFAEIREQEPNALWIGDDTGIYFNNYMVANGLRTIDSTNVYPNFELFETLLGENAEPQRKYFNRYEHVNIEISEEETHIYLPANDNIVITLNYNDINKLNADYIVTKDNINERGYDMYFEEIYHEYDLYIFKVCK